MAKLYFLALIPAIVLLILTHWPQETHSLPLEDGNVPACFHPVLTCKIKGTAFRYTNLCGRQCSCDRPDTEICDPGCADDVKTWFEGLSSYSAYFKRCKELRRTLKIDYE